MLGDQQETPVIAAIIDAVGKAWDESATLRILPFVEHPEVEVRRSVAQALVAGVETIEAQERVAIGLVTLSANPDDEVREWATFGLGSQLRLDTPTVRAALWARVSDPFRNVRDEALVGLARRRDRRITALVAAALREETASGLLFEAAEYLADPQLFDALSLWQTQRPDDPEVVGAANACDSAFQKRRAARHVALLESVQRTLSGALPDAYAVLYCDLYENDVVLAVSPWRWSVDALLERAEQDAKAAAAFVASDYFALPAS